jgi:hypothetical protein
MVDIAITIGLYPLGKQDTAKPMQFPDPSAVAVNMLYPQDASAYDMLARFIDHEYVLLERAGTDLEQAHQLAKGDGAYERPADTFLSGSMSDCAVKGFVRNAMHPESKAAVRMAGLSLAVM